MAYDSFNCTANPLRILIADDHATLRKALRELFGQRPELQVVAEASNGAEAVYIARTLQPDLIVMDVSMPQMDGIEATRVIHCEHPSIAIVGLSTFHDDSIRHAMCEAGAKAYFTKNENADQLLDYVMCFRAQARETA